MPYSLVATEVYPDLSDIVFSHLILKPKVVHNHKLVGKLNLPLSISQNSRWHPRWALNPDRGVCGIIHEPLDVFQWSRSRSLGFKWC